MSKAGGIKDIFNIFHDGSIELVSFNNDDLQLHIEIQYLAQIVDSSFESFRLTLRRVESLTFEPWTGVNGTETDWKKILNMDLNIVSAEVNEAQEVVIHVTCGEPLDASFDGGRILLSCKDYAIFDEKENAITLDELKAYSSTYWNENFSKTK